MDTSIDEAIIYFKRTSDEDFKTAQALYNAKRYADCLFFCFLSLERILKAVMVSKTKKHPSLLMPNLLLELVETSGLNLTNAQEEDIKEINTFDRFDDYTFYKYEVATKVYTHRFLVKTEKLIEWLKKQI